MGADGCYTRIVRMTSTSTSVLQSCSWLSPCGSSTLYSSFPSPTPLSCPASVRSASDAAICTAECYWTVRAANQAWDHVLIGQWDRRLLLAERDGLERYWSGLPPKLPCGRSRDSRDSSSSSYNARQPTGDSYSPPTINAPLTLPAPPINMKYRSPSPSNALPTPPQSPTSQDIAHSAVTLLDSLETFYQQERYWVHHTRAALELALTKGIDAPAAVDAPSPSSSQGALSPASSTLSDTTLVDAPIVKKEPETAPSPPLSLSLSRPPSTRWMRRKNNMRLKLDSLSLQSRKRRPMHASPTEPGARLLEMFSELMDARMESCQRVQRMVRSANRADLYMR